MEKEVVDLLPEAWREQFRLFSLDQPNASFATIGGKKTLVPHEEMLGKYNSDEYDPRCGYLVKAADELAAYIEADQGLKNGCAHAELTTAKVTTGKKYELQEFGDLNLGMIYRELRA